MGVVWVEFLSSSNVLHFTLKHGSQYTHGGSIGGWRGVGTHRHYYVMTLGHPVEHTGFMEARYFSLMMASFSGVLR